MHVFSEVSKYFLIPPYTAELKYNLADKINKFLLMFCVWYIYIRLSYESFHLKLFHIYSTNSLNQNICSVLML